MRPKLLFIVALLCFAIFSHAQNVGIGTTNPLQKLHVQGNTYVKDSLGIGIVAPRATMDVNGTFRLQHGVVVNQVSADSNFSPGSDSILPTQKSIRRYIQKGSWAAPPGYSDTVLVWKHATNTNINNPLQVYVQGNYAYVVSYSNNLLCIYDISNREQIRPRGTISTNLSGPSSVFVKGNYAYVTSQTNNRLCIYDISNPDAIAAKDFTSINLFFPSSVVVQDNYAYVASTGNHALCVFDISDPTNIHARGVTSTNLNSPMSVVVQGNYAYVASYANSRLCIYDISNPDALVAKGYTNINLQIPTSVFVQGNYVYLASVDRMSIYDISNPDIIVPKGVTSVPMYDCRSVFVQGNYAYVTSASTNGLYMFDVTNPDMPSLAASTNTQIRIPNSVFATGNYVYTTSTTNDALTVFKKQVLNNSVLTFTDNGDVAFVRSGSWAVSGEDIHRRDGNIGIGTTTPNVRLHLVGGNMKIDSVYYLELGGGMAGKEVNAGRIGYHTFSPDALDIMGAGSTVATRKIKFWSEGGAVFTGSIGIQGANTLELGAGIAGKENNAGKMGYQIFSPDALDIVGAGTVQLNRKIKFWNEGGAVFAGSLQAPAYVVVSDARFKKDIDIISSPLEKLLQLRGVTYQFNHREWPSRYFPMGQQYGFLAQEVEKVLPHLVTTGNDGYKAVNYEAIIPLLTESIKAQQRQIQLLQEQVDALKALIGKK